MTDEGKQLACFFYGLQSNWWWDRLYRIYVSDKMLAGAYIAGQIYDEQSAAIQLQKADLFFRPLVRRWLAQRQEREALYDAVDPFSRLLLHHDLRNFQIWRSDVARTRFRRNPSLWTLCGNVGAVELKLRDGKTWLFILVGDQQPDEILRIMQRFDAAIEAAGKPNPRPRPKPMSLRGKRFYLVMLAVWLLGCGILFGSIAGTGLAANPIHWPLAVANVLGSVWCLVKAWNISPSQPETSATE